MSICQRLPTNAMHVNERHKMLLSKRKTQSMYSYRRRLRLRRGPLPRPFNDNLVIFPLPTKLFNLNQLVPRPTLLITRATTHNPTDMHVEISTTNSLERVP